MLMSCMFTEGGEGCTHVLHDACSEKGSTFRQEIFVMTGLLIPKSLQMPFLCCIKSCYYKDYPGLGN